MLQMLLRLQAPERRAGSVGTGGGKRSRSLLSSWQGRWPARRLAPERTDRQDKPRESADSEELDPLVTLFNSEPWRMDDAERAAQEALRGLGHAGTELRLIRLGENALFHAPAIET